MAERIYLVRHSAYYAERPKGLTDFGRKLAAKTAQTLSPYLQRSIVVGLYHGPLLRVKQTAAIISEGTGFAAREELLLDEGFNPETVETWVRELPEDTVVLVIHEADITALLYQIGALLNFDDYFALYSYFSDNAMEFCAILEFNLQAKTIRLIKD